MCDPTFRLVAQWMLVCERRRFYYTPESEDAGGNSRTAAEWSAVDQRLASSREGRGSHNRAVANCSRAALTNSGLSLSPRKCLHPAFFKGIRPTWLPPEPRVWYVRDALDLKSVVSSSRFVS